MEKTIAGIQPAQSWGLPPALAAYLVASSRKHRRYWDNPLTPYEAIDLQPQRAEGNDIDHAKQAQKGAACRHIRRRSRGAILLGSEPGSELLRLARDKAEPLWRSWH